MERLQKFMAHAGIASRRKCEEIIAAGRVRVNGKIVTEMGTKVNPRRDKVSVDGEPIKIPSQKKVYIMLNKPRGYLSDFPDPHGRATVQDLVDLPTRLYPVGRLDLDSEGLLLLTNDGKLAYRLTHPRYEHEKEYKVCVQGNPNRDVLQRWRAGVDLDGQKTARAEVDFVRREGNNTWLRIVLHEGRKRQIRRVADLFGHPIQRIMRVRIDTLRLTNLEKGKWRRLTKREVYELRKNAGLS